MPPNGEVYPESKCRRTTLYALTKRDPETGKPAIDYYTVKGARLIDGASKCAYITSRLNGAGRRRLRRSRPPNRKSAIEFQRCSRPFGE